MFKSSTGFSIFAVNDLEPNLFVFSFMTWAFLCFKSLSNEVFIGIAIASNSQKTCKLPKTDSPVSFISTFT